MARRQIRILASSIPEKISDLIGKSANIVLRDRSVYLVTVLVLKGSLLETKNRRNRKQEFKLQQIEEIILDY